jgi:hypothetical protein
MSSSFKDVEIAFRALRRQFREKEISRREFIDRLKKLRLRDSQGRFWMIGAQSGKWYFFDGRDWVLSDPPSEDSGRAKCLSCGLENEGGADTCARCGESLKEKEAACPACGMPLENPYQKCPACSRGAKVSPLDEEVLLKTAKEDLVLRRLSALSLFFFSGGTGLILGIILGAFAGASDFFSAMAKLLPDALGTLQGTLMGGIVFAALGGLLGFVLLGAIGTLQAHLFNGISAVVGGFRVSLDHVREKEKVNNKTP